MDFNALKNIGDGLIKLPDTAYKVAQEIINLFEKIFEILKRVIIEGIDLSKVLLKMFKVLVTLTDKFILFLLNKGVFLADLIIWLSPLVISIYFGLEALKAFSKANIGKFEYLKPFIKEMILASEVIFNIIVYFKLDWNVSFNPFSVKNKEAAISFKDKQLSDLNINRKTIKDLQKKNRTQNTFVAKQVENNLDFIPPSSNPIPITIRDQLPQIPGLNPIFGLGIGTGFSI